MFYFYKTFLLPMKKNKAVDEENITKHVQAFFQTEWL